MITYEYFNEVMTDLKAAQDFQNEVYGAIEHLRKKNLRYLCTDFMGEEVIMIAHDERVLQLMSKLFADGDNSLADAINEILNWYCWDTNWGTENNEVEYPDGTKKNIVTFQDVYDDIICTINDWLN